MSEREIASAKKAYPLIPSGHANPAAAELEAKWNAKWARAAPADAQALAQKIADFRALKTAIAALPLPAGPLKESAKAKAEATAASLGLTGEDKKDFDALAAVAGAGWYQTGQSKLAQAQAAGAAVNITAAELGAICAYTDGSYGAINASLREEKLIPEQFRYVQVLNRALAKLPAYTEPTRRWAGLTPEQQARYAPGVLVHDQGFASMSKSSGESDITFEVVGKCGRDIAFLSSHPSEGEVLYPAGMWFRVTEKDGNTVRMEEV